MPSPRTANKTRNKLRDAWLMRQPSVSRNLCCGKPTKRPPITAASRIMPHAACLIPHATQSVGYLSAASTVYIAYLICARLPGYQTASHPNILATGSVNNAFYWVMPLIWRRHHNNELIAPALNSGACQFGAGWGISFTCHVSWFRKQQPTTGNCNNAPRAKQLY